MNAAVLAFDVATCVGFAAAIVVLVMIPSGPDSAYSSGAKAFSIASAATYVLVSLSDVLNRLGMGTVLHAVESQVELLWAPFVLFAIYSLYARQQLNDAKASRREAVEAGEMTNRIMELTPAGVVMLDPSGELVFFNESARELLDLERDPATGKGMAPPWAMRVTIHGATSGDPTHGFQALLREEPLNDALVIVEWPTGWRRRLSVNTATMTTADGGVAGTLAAFVEHEPWRSHPR